VIIGNFGAHRDRKAYKGLAVFFKRFDPDSVQRRCGRTGVHLRVQIFHAQSFVSFTIPMGAEVADYHCEALVYGQRRIKSSNGVMQTRYVIETVMKLGPLEWVGHMTLANRQSMIFPVLIGRRALKRGFLVNSAKRWMLGRHEER
jgi:hypothetical protein